MTQIKSPSEQIRSIKKAHTATTTSKSPLLLNSKVVIPFHTAAANAENVFAYAAPLVEVDKATGQAWTALGLIYWDDTAKKFTTTSTSNTLAGRIAKDAASGDTTGYIDLDPAA